MASFFQSLKQNFIAYRSSKVSSRPDCILKIYQLWQSGFSRVYSNCCSFEPEIIKIDLSFHKMYSNNIVNFQECTTILNATTKKLIVCTSLLPFIHHRVKTHNVFPLIPQRMKLHKELHLFVENQEHNLGYERNPNSKIMPRRERREKKKLILWMNSALHGMASLVKRIPKEKTCPRGKEQ